jgi:hypothetical protein
MDETLHALFRYILHSLSLVIDQNHYRSNEFPTLAGRTRRIFRTNHQARAAFEVGLTAVKADDIYGTRPVIRANWELIWTARAVVAIVTGQNPNVNYELGMCHTLGISTILVIGHQEEVPFDYRHRRYVRYATQEADGKDSAQEARR